MVLGIIGGSIIICAALSMIFNYDIPYTGIRLNLYDTFYMENGVSEIIFHLIAGIVYGIVGILGLIGGLIVRQKNVAGGVMMIIAAALSVIFGNLASMVLFIIGAVYALEKERPNPVYPYPPQTPYPQASYHQYIPQPPAPPQQPQGAPKE